VRSPETYVGLARTVGFASPRGAHSTRPACTRCRRDCTPTSGHSRAIGPCGAKAQC
jgi:hypothetical protein